MQYDTHTIKKNKVKNLLSSIKLSKILKHPNLQNFLNGWYNNEVINMNYAESNVMLENYVYS